MLPGLKKKRNPPRAAAAEMFAMMTVRFSSHPVTSFKVDALGETLREDIALDEVIIEPATARFETLGEMQDAFALYFDEVERAERPALIIVTWLRKLGDTPFEGFGAWAKHDMRVHYDKLDETP